MQIDEWEWISAVAIANKNLCRESILDMGETLGIRFVMPRFTNSILKSSTPYIFIEYDYESGKHIPNKHILNSRIHAGTNGLRALELQTVIHLGKTLHMCIHDIHFHETIVGYQEEKYWKISGSWNVFAPEH
jgi:hypothetical protein